MTNNVQAPGGNTTTAGAVEQIEMARRIVKQSLTPENHKRCHCRDEIDEGKWDNGMNVRVALAAIIETTEAAAKFAYSHPYVGKHAMPCLQARIRDGILSGDHLKGPKP